MLIASTAAIGCLAAWITERFAPEAAGSGIPHIKAVLLHLRTLRAARVIAVKMVAGLLALASGMSLGREGPTVQIGAAVGKLTGDLFRVPRRSYSALIAAGSGAGLAAAFNAPLAGFLFVMEELRREMSPIAYGTALLASVCSVAVTRYLLGQAPSFVMPSPGPAPLIALGPIAVFGVIAGFAGVAFNRALMGALTIREKLKAPRWAAGLVVGAMAAVLAASVRAPLTGVVLIVEMTAEYQLLYALLVCSFAAYATAELLGDDPIYEALLELDLHQNTEFTEDETEPSIIDFLVEPDSQMDGRKIRDLQIPEGTLITVVARNNRHLVPRGTTQLRAGAWSPSWSMVTTG